jgi:hypothetical protein
MMKDLFGPALADDIEQRIMRPHPESERRWGNMTVAQTLAHCRSGMQTATGMSSTPTQLLSGPSLSGKSPRDMHSRN